MRNNPETHPAGEPTTEALKPLNADVRADFYNSMPTGRSDQQHLLHVGNTGLLIQIDYVENSVTWNMHFRPDRQGSPPKTTAEQLKYSKIFAYALSHLIKYIRTNRQELKSFWEKYGDKPPHDRSVWPELLPAGKITLYFGTNETMFEFRKKLLGHYITGTAQHGQIDFDGLMNDPDLMLKLQELSDRCERENYQMKPGYYE